MKNIEKYYDVLLNQDYYDLDCYFTEQIMKEECANKKDCAECKKAFIKWLNEEYREPIKLTQFELDLLLITKEYNRTLGELENNIYFEKLQEKGYFKNVDLSMTAKEVLERCKVIEEEHKKSATLSADEEAILRNLPEEYKYIARDSNANISVYKTKPTKKLSIWVGLIGGNTAPLNLYNHLFQFVKWEDDEPYSIEELLKENTYESSR